MRRAAFATAVTCVALAAAVLAACGEQKLDTGDAESAIKAGITRQTGLRIAAVRCPDEVEAKRGDSFRCVAVARNGDRATVQVTQRDDQGKVTWRLVRSR